MPSQVVRGSGPTAARRTHRRLGEPKKEQDAAGKAKAIPRKIQYTADFQLVTDQFTTVETTLHTLIDETQGFVSFADVYTQTGSPRHGVWRARIPIAKFDSFRKGIAKVGEVVRTSVQTKDVTAEYYDLEEHVKSEKAQEEALRELLKRTTDKIENILAVRRELGSIRDEIERSEGRMRLMANLSDLTTVTIQMQEFAKFDPDRPTPTKEDPTFAGKADKAFRDSWSGLVFCAQIVALAIVVLTPWLPLIAVAAGIGWLVYRRLPKPTVVVPVVEKPTTTPTI